MKVTPRAGVASEENTVGHMDGGVNSWHVDKMHKISHTTGHRVVAQASSSSTEYFGESCEYWGVQRGSGHATHAESSA